MVNSFITIILEHAIEFKCWKCNGSGVLKRNFLFSLRKCPVCKGKGKINSCSEFHDRIEINPEHFYVAEFLESLHKFITEHRTQNWSKKKNVINLFASDHPNEEEMARVMQEAYERKNKNV